MNYSPEEMKARLMLVQKIVVASRTIRNLPLLEGKKLQDATEAWEAAFAGVATKQLPELYRIGLMHKCYTAEQFQNVWEMKVEAEARAAEHRQRVAQRDEPEVARPIPQHILDKWQREQQATAVAAARRSA